MAQGFISVVLSDRVGAGNGRAQRQARSGEEEGGEGKQAHETKGTPAVESEYSQGTSS